MSVSEITLLNQGKVKDWRKVAADTANALNTSVVHNTENEIINGVKTFTEIINGTVSAAVNDVNGDAIASTYLKVADAPTIVMTSSEPTAAGTTDLPMNSLILWAEDEEEPEQP